MRSNVLVRYALKQVVMTKYDQGKQRHEHAKGCAREIPYPFAQLCCESSNRCRDVCLVTYFT